VKKLFLMLFAIVSSSVLAGPCEDISGIYSSNEGEVLSIHSLSNENKIKMFFKGFTISIVPNGEVNGKVNSVSNEHLKIKCVDGGFQFTYTGDNKSYLNFKRTKFGVHITGVEEGEVEYRSTIQSTGGIASGLGGEVKVKDYSEDSVSVEHYVEDIDLKFFEL